MFRTERRSPEFLARWISAVTIFPSEGARDPLSEAALAEAFEKGGWQDITGLCRARTCRKTLLASRAWMVLDTRIPALLEDIGSPGAGSAAGRTSVNVDRWLQSAGRSAWHARFANQR